MAFSRCAFFRGGYSVHRFRQMQGNCTRHCGGECSMYPLFYTSNNIEYWKWSTTPFSRPHVQAQGDFTSSVTQSTSFLIGDVSTKKNMNHFRYYYPLILTIPRVTSLAIFFSSPRVFARLRKASPFFSEGCTAVSCHEFLCCHRCKGKGFYWNMRFHFPQAMEKMLEENWSPRTIIKTKRKDFPSTGSIGLHPVMIFFANPWFGLIKRDLLS